MATNPVTQFNPALLNDKGLAKIKMESDHSIERLKIERGWLGRIWGTSTSVPNNIAAFTVFLLLFVGAMYSWLAYGQPKDDTTLSIKDFWAIISPLITLATGYLFGNKNSQNSDK